ncbi:Rho-type gtpase-activating protein [Coemansia sp. RSA 2530]|nr:Rho-type gtpase-activating protein [Coemansia sp. RSA 2530]
MSELLGTDSGSVPATVDGSEGVLSAPPKCWGCQNAIDGGSAIQFADGVWHIDCKIIEFDSNLLFLADGKPICPECSYCCSLCKKPIFDEAIVTVEGTYHSECFRCTNCKQRIQGKSFAKTSQGVIYCVGCYAERRERKKAAKRRREQGVGEEKMLPSLPAEAETAESASPVALSPLVDEGVARQAGGQSDLRSRRRGMHTPGELGGNAELTLSQAIEMTEEPGPKGGEAGGSGLTLIPVGSSSGGGSPAALRACAAAASAPTSPTRDGYASYRPQGLTLAPITPLHASLSADPIFDLKLAWTEDISSLENNYVRYSMRTPVVKQSDAATNRSSGALQSPRRETVAVAAAVRDEERAGSPLLRVASGSRSPAGQRARAASSASALSNFVPPGLRSTGRDVDGSSQQSLARPSPLGADGDPDGKEWLNSATVEQLKEELLVNYGQFCRMEASYQKLKDLYASVIDQLLETREALVQERAKRAEAEAQLRPGADAPAGDQAKAPRARSGAADRADSQRSKHAGSRGTLAKAGGSAQVGRQPSLRRQRQARRQDAENESGSDDDAIITTVPQKATKRFIWPFGGHHEQAGAKPVDGGQHSFHVASTFRAGKCDHCQERLKTFTNSVVRCRICGFVCHQRCAAEVTAACAAADARTSSAGRSAAPPDALVYDPNVPFVADRMFGRALAEQTALEGRSVPWVVRAAIAFIEAEGLTMEGVYRRSGSTMDIRAVLVEITRQATATANRFGDEPAIAPGETDVSSVTSVLKQYFRDLPNPLMTAETYHLWVQASNIASAEERVKVYRTISESMPVAHGETLRYLMTHLKRVADHQQENKMTANNLSVVFAPNILHMGKNDVLQEMANMSGISRTVSFLIQHADDVWAPRDIPSELPFARPPMRRLKDMNMLTVNAISPAAEPLDVVDGLGRALESSSLSQSMPSPKELFFGEGAVPERLASHHRNVNKSSFDMPRGNK